MNPLSPQCALESAVAMRRLSSKDLIPFRSEVCLTEFLDRTQTLSRGAWRPERSLAENYQRLRRACSDRVSKTQCPVSPDDGYSSSQSDLAPCVRGAVSSIRGIRRASDLS